MQISPSAAKFLKQCNDELYTRLTKKISTLEREPFPPDAKRVIGRKEKTFRVRVGDYRILYVQIENEILIADIDKRSRIYD